MGLGPTSGRMFSNSRTRRSPERRAAGGSLAQAATDRGARSDGEVGHLSRKLNSATIGVGPAQLARDGRHPCQNSETPASSHCERSAEFGSQFRSARYGQGTDAGHVVPEGPAGKAEVRNILTQVRETQPSGRVRCKSRSTCIYSSQHVGQTPRQRTGPSRSQRIPIGAAKVRHVYAGERAKSARLQLGRNQSRSGSRSSRRRCSS